MDNDNQSLFDEIFDEHIPNMAVYLKRMEKGMLDKILFMAHIDADLIIDYGCANGAMLKILAAMYPQKQFIGYDISKTMIEAAFYNCEGLLNVVFTDDWNTVLAIKEKSKNEKTCVCLSSVIHEVYSYSSHKQVDEFYKNVFANNFDYVAIRDMYYDSRSMYFTLQNRIAIHKCEENISKSKYGSRFDEYKTLRGIPLNKSITEHFDYIRDFFEFLLKYQYSENWERESVETYLPHGVQRRLGGEAKHNNYSKIFDIKYTLPYIKECVKRDFDYNLTNPTHYQYIFKKN